MKVKPFDWHAATSAEKDALNMRHREETKAKRARDNRFQPLSIVEQVSDNINRPSLNHTNMKWWAVY